MSDGKDVVLLRASTMAMMNGQWFWDTGVEPKVDDDKDLTALFAQLQRAAVKKMYADPGEILGPLMAKLAQLGFRPNQGAGEAVLINQMAAEGSKQELLVTASGASRLTFKAPGDDDTVEVTYALHGEDGEDRDAPSSDGHDGSAGVHVPPEADPEKKDEPGDTDEQEVDAAPDGEKEQAREEEPGGDEEQVELTDAASEDDTEDETPAGEPPSDALLAEMERKLANLAVIRKKSAALQRETEQQHLRTERLNLRTQELSGEIERVRSEMDGHFSFLEGVSQQIASMLDRQGDLSRSLDATAEILEREKKLSRRVDKQDETIADHGSLIEELKQDDVLGRLSGYLREQTHELRAGQKARRKEELEPLFQALSDLDTGGHLGKRGKDLRGRLGRLDQQELEEAAGADTVLDRLAAALEARQQQGESFIPRIRSGLQDLALRTCKAVFAARGSLDGPARPMLEALCEPAMIAWIDPAPGTPFKSQRHEVAGTERAAFPPNTVVRVESPGFLVDGNLVAKAKVVLNDG